MTTDDRKFNKQRRKFLDMVTKAGISTALWRASPFVGGAMVNRFAEAAGETPKRFLTFNHPAGAPQGSYMPSSISSMNQSSQPFAEVAPYCNFHLVNVIGGQHGAAHAAMSLGTGNSFDIQLSRLLSTNTPYSAINLGIRVPKAKGDVIGRINGQPVYPESDANTAYNTYFGGPPPGGAAEALFKKQAAALDANKEALAALMKKLGNEEKIRLEEHFAALDRIRKRLDDASKFVPPEGCADPVIAAQNAMDEGGGVQTEIKIMGEIAITAMRCGLSNVATIQLDDSQSEWRYAGPTFSEGHHQTCHGRGRNDLITITKYMNVGVAHIIKTLIDTPDPAGGNMIDNTVFLQTTDQDGVSHTTGGCPNLMATNMPGFPKGRVGGGGSNRALMLDIAEGLGVRGQIVASNADINKYADMA